MFNALVPESELEQVPELSDGLTPDDALSLVSKDLMPKFMVERRRLDRIDRWARWDHDLAHRPRQATPEYRELIKMAPTPWLGLVVTEIAQGLFVEGYRGKGQNDEAGPWAYWQANRMDGRQSAIHRGALTYGTAYAVVLPGSDPLTGAKMPVVKGVSPRRGMAFYSDPATDEWPTYFLRVEPQAGAKWSITLYDDEWVYPFVANVGGSDVKASAEAPYRHGAPICPAVRYNNLLDLEARADGEVEPFIDVAARINQTVADRLIVQRFASWVTRTVTGLTKDDDADPEDVRAKKLLLAVDSLLVAENPDVKFGTLQATSLDGFILARDADIQDLAAVTQIPPYALLMNKMANLSADALAAAASGLANKIGERQHSFGESHEQMLRLCAAIMDDEQGARDTSAQVHWKDMGSRSLAQAADALGKMAQMLGVPVEMLWEQIPGWTEQDVERAKALAQQEGGMAALMQHLSMGAAPAGVPGAPADQPYGGERQTGDSGNGAG